MDGWIKLYRKLLDNPIFEDPVKLAVWVFLLLSATHEARDVMIGDQRVTLAPGQLITSRTSIAKRFKISESKARRTLDFFEREGQIDQRCSTHSRVITLVHWDTYQAAERDVTDTRPAHDPQLTINKKDKKDKKIPPMSPRGDGSDVFESFWTAYPKKVGKRDALNCWNRLRPDGALIGTMHAALDAAKNSAQWRREDGRYIPNPATWLKQERWTDELSGDTHPSAPVTEKTAETKALRRLAEKRSGREQTLAMRREALRRASPAFLENEKALRLCASQAARSRGKEREAAEQKRAALLALQAEILAAEGRPPDWLADQPDCSLCNDRGYVGTTKCRCLLAMLEEDAGKEP